jgi:hypothetical protein
VQISDPSHPNDQGDDFRLQQQVLNMYCIESKEHILRRFSDSIANISAFAVRGDDADWDRSFICGIIWLRHSTCVNIIQLRILVNKCKSNVNASS